MNTEPNTPPDDDTDEESTPCFGFDWQRYKNDRRALHEKLVREQDKPTQPTQSVGEE